MEELIEIEKRIEETEGHLKLLKEQRIKITSQICQSYREKHPFVYLVSDEVFIKREDAEKEYNTDVYKVYKVDSRLILDYMLLNLK